MRSIKNKKRVDGKWAFNLEDPTNVITEALDLTDTDVFLNIREFFILLATYSSHQPKVKELHQVWCNYRQSHQSPMSDKRESDLDFTASTENIKNWNTKCRSDVHQIVFPKNILKICTIRKLTVVKSKKQTFVKH